MLDYPRSLIAFQHRFPDEAACAAYLADLRWSDGFCCPACGHGAAGQQKPSRRRGEAVFPKVEIFGQRLIPLVPGPQYIDDRRVAAW